MNISKFSFTIGFVVFIALFFLSGFLYRVHGGTLTEVGLDADALTALIDEPATPRPVAVSQKEVGIQPHDGNALGGYNVLIADRGNNRLVEVTPDKQIVWEYQFNLPRPGLGADDAFFADGNKTVIVNLEEYHLIQLIDYRTKKVIWSYGVPGKPGEGEGFLNTPDDAYKLPNGDVTVADIKNCRVIEIAPDKRIVHQYGKTKQCSSDPGYLNKPNGDTPLQNGHMFISNIIGHNLIELDEQWQPIFSMKLPVSYPSDPQPTKAGNVLLTNYRKPGAIVEVSKSGRVVWWYGGDKEYKLNRPSLAIELPNGNILANDDFNHRVIVVDKKSKQIVWQYGVSGKPGRGKGQLNIPDGLDIVKR